MRGYTRVKKKPETSEQLLACYILGLMLTKNPWDATSLGDQAPLSTWATSDLTLVIHTNSVEWVAVRLSRFFFHPRGGYSIHTYLRMLAQRHAGLLSQH